MAYQAECETWDGCVQLEPYSGVFFGSFLGCRGRVVVCRIGMR